MTRTQLRAIENKLHLQRRKNSIGEYLEKCRSLPSLNGGELGGVFSSDRTGG